MGNKEKIILTVEEKKRLMTLYFLKRWSILDISKQTSIPPTSLYKWKLQYQDEFSQIKDDERLKEKYLKESEDLTSIIRKSKAKLKRKAVQTSKVKPTKETTDISHSVDVYVPKSLEEEQRIQTKEQIQLNELNKKIDIQVQDALFIKNSFLNHLKEIGKAHETITLQLVEEKNKQLAYSEQRIKQLEEENSRLKTLISTLIA